MKKFRIYISASCLFLLFVSLSVQSPPAVTPLKPKFVVGIVVDQMHYDFLFRYWDKYGSGGFRRLVNEGYSCNNTHFNYFPTYTGPGHSSIYTGSVPAITGIVGNVWYDKTSNANVYVTEDAGVSTVGSPTAAGKMSPKNMLTTTITDQLRLSNNFQSKVIGIALKDRGAILPAGHTANAAYWFDGSDGNWISSTYYMDSLPRWVNDFNAKKYPEKYLMNDWNTLLPISEYTESTKDDELYEEGIPGEGTTVFPHKVAAMTGKNFEVIRTTPFGNSLTKDFAIESIKNEKLGKGNVTDFLTVSFSSTDYVGHQFGPYSIETEDTYLRLDKDLSEFLSFLDAWMGKQNVLVFLTSDHGIAPAPDFALQHNIPAGIINEVKLADTIKKVITKQFGDGALMLTYLNQQLYLNQELMAKMNLTEEKIFSAIQPAVIRFNGVRNIFLTKEPEHSSLPVSMIEMMRNSFYPKRCGDIMVIYEPYWIGERLKGTTHGSIFSYDTHVPLLWYGWDIKHGASSSLVHISDIAPTIADFLQIQQPNGCVGNPIQGLR